MRKLFALLAAAMLMGSVEAFAGSIKLPDSLRRIEEEAFFGDTSMEKVELPEDVEYVGPRAFGESTVKEVIFPHSLETIGEDAFPVGTVGYGPEGSAGADYFMNTEGLSFENNDPSSQKPPVFDEAGAVIRSMLIDNGTPVAYLHIPLLSWDEKASDVLLEVSGEIPYATSLTEYTTMPGDDPNQRYGVVRVRMPAQGTTLRVECEGWTNTKTEGPEGRRVITGSSDRVPITVTLSTFSIQPSITKFYFPGEIEVEDYLADYAWIIGKNIDPDANVWLCEEGMAGSGFSFDSVVRTLGLDENDYSAFLVSHWSQNRTSTFAIAECSGLSASCSQKLIVDWEAKTYSLEDENQMHLDFIDDKNNSKKIESTTVTDYNPATGNLKISWECNGADHFHVRAILLDEEPIDESQEAKVTLKDSSDYTETSIEFTGDQLAAASYLKIAVQGMDSAGNVSNYPWIGYRIHHPFHATVDGRNWSTDVEPIFKVHYTKEKSVNRVQLYAVPADHPEKDAWVFIMENTESEGNLIINALNYADLSNVSNAGQLKVAVVPVISEPQFDMAAYISFYCIPKPENSVYVESAMVYPITEATTDWEKIRQQEEIVIQDVIVKSSIYAWENDLACYYIEYTPRTLQTGDQGDVFAAIYIGHLPVNEFDDELPYVQAALNKIDRAIGDQGYPDQAEQIKSMIVDAADPYKRLFCYGFISPKTYEIKDLEYSGTPNYSREGGNDPKGVYFDLSKDKIGMNGELGSRDKINTPRYETFFHENGHGIDSTFRELKGNYNASSNYLFSFKYKYNQKDINDILVDDFKRVFRAQDYKSYIQNNHRNAWSQSDWNQEAFQAIINMCYSPSLNNIPEEWTEPTHPYYAMTEFFSNDPVSYFVLDELQRYNDNSVEEWVLRDQWLTEVDRRSYLLTKESWFKAMYEEWDDSLLEQVLDVFLDPNGEQAVLNTKPARDMYFQITLYWKYKMLNSNQGRNVSDIIGGITNNQILGIAGHTGTNNNGLYTYWYQIKGNKYTDNRRFYPIMEFWAHYFSANMIRDWEQISVLRKYFPETCNALDDMAEYMAGEFERIDHEF